MKVTIEVDDDLIETARRLTGTRELSTLNHDGLTLLISRHSAIRLAQLGGSDPLAAAPPRRRAT